MQTLRRGSYGQFLNIKAINLLFIAALLPSCYVSKLAWHQNNLFNSRRQITDVMNDPQTDLKTKNALRSLNSILNFAEENGLNSKGAYSYYIPSKNRYVSYLVQAAYADQLKSRTWWFPIVGTVPYKGFFDEKDRDELALSLKSEGLDVYRSGVGAYSSLGWFDDPVYPSMVGRRLSSRAHLFFHELTHRTFWWRGSTKFNENLAEYVAGYLTEKYLRSSQNKKELEVYFKRKEDKALYKVWLKSLKKSLKKLYGDYKQQGDQLTKKEKLSEAHRRKVLLEKKAAIIAKFTGVRRPKFALADYVGQGEWNNARILGASLYSPNTKRFAKAHNCLANPTIGNFLQKLKKSLNTTDSRFEALDALCAQSELSRQTKP